MLFTLNCVSWSHVLRSGDLNVKLCYNKLMHDVVERAALELTADDILQERVMSSHNQSPRVKRHSVDVNTESRPSSRNTVAHQRRRAALATELASHRARSRQRRTAALLVSATVQLCNEHQHLCKTIEIKEDDVRVTLNLRDA